MVRSASPPTSSRPRNWFGYGLGLSVEGRLLHFFGSTCLSTFILDRRLCLGIPPPETVCFSLSPRFWATGPTDFNLITRLLLMSSTTSASTFALSLIGPLLPLGHKLRVWISWEGSLLKKKQSCRKLLSEAPPKSSMSELLNEFFVMVGKLSPIFWGVFLTFWIGASFFWLL